MYIYIYCIYFTDWIRLRYHISYNLINHSIPVYSRVARKECVVVGCLSLGSVRDQSHLDFRELQSDPYEEIYSFIWEEFHDRTSLRNGLLAGRRPSCFRFPIPSHHPTIPPHRSWKCCSWRPNPNIDSTFGTRILATAEGPGWSWWVANSLTSGCHFWYHDLPDCEAVEQEGQTWQRFQTFLEAVFCWTMFEVMALMLGQGHHR